ncbi:MAG: hypothetical protein ACK52L_21295 [Pirellula sp.]
MSYDEIKAKDFSFSAGQYFEVEIDQVDISAAEFTAAKQEFQKQLTTLFEETRNKETEVLKQLAKLDIR